MRNKSSDNAIRYLVIPPDVNMDDAPSLKAPEGKKFSFQELFIQAIQYVPCGDEKQAAIYESLTTKFRSCEEGDVKVLEADEHATLIHAIQLLRNGGGVPAKAMLPEAQIAFTQHFVAIARAARTDPRPKVEQEAPVERAASSPQD